MFEQIQKIKKHQNGIAVVLKDWSFVDEDAFERISRDESCLECRATDVRRKTVDYDSSSLISLERLLKDFTFEKEDAYSFFLKLFRQIENSALTKAIVLDVRWIFLSPMADRIYFLGVPLGLECWMYQQQELKNFLSQILSLVSLNTGLEIAGFFYLIQRREHLTVSDLIAAFEKLESLYVKKISLFYKKQPKPFRLKKPLFNPEEQQTSLPGYPVNEKPLSSFIQEENRTMIINPFENTAPRVVIEGISYQLKEEACLAGSAKDCQIVLNELQPHHAWFERADGKCWLRKACQKALIETDNRNSSRRIRLTDGMNFKLDGYQGTFYE